MPDSRNFSNPSTDPLRNFRFLAVIAPHDKGPQWAVKYDSYIGFTSVSGLAMTIDSIPYREGGYNTTYHQIPGQASFSPITLSRGVSIGSRQNHNWTRALFNTVLNAGTSVSGEDFRARVYIKVLDHPVTGNIGLQNNGGFPFPPVKVMFTIHNCWITSLAYSDLNAGDNALLVEQMTLAHEGWEMSWADNPGTDSIADPDRTS